MTHPIVPGPDARTPRCEQCGYSLHGLTDHGKSSRCPECGSEFDRDAPWMPASWPSVATLALMLCGPTMGVMAALLASAAAKPVRNAVVWPFWLPWMLGILFVQLWWPWILARKLADARLARVERAGAVGRLCIPAVIFNSCVVLASLGAGALLL